jgi:hypothetical protein
MRSRGASGSFGWWCCLYGFSDVVLAVEWASVWEVCVVAGAFALRCWVGFCRSHWHMVLCRTDQTTTRRRAGEKNTSCDSFESAETQCECYRVVLHVVEYLVAGCRYTSLDYLSICSTFRHHFSSDPVVLDLDSSGWWSFEDCQCVADA